MMMASAEHPDTQIFFSHSVRAVVGGDDNSDIGEDFNRRGDFNLVDLYPVDTSAALRAYFSVGDCWALNDQRLGAFWLAKGLLDQR